MNIMITGLLNSGKSFLADAINSKYQLDGDTTNIYEEYFATHSKTNWGNIATLLRHTKNKPHKHSIIISQILPQELSPESSLESSKSTQPIKDWLKDLFDYIYITENTRHMD